jgi:anthranilate phosphoribosyltransferase
LTPAEAARSLREHRFAFFFAPQYHPAFRHIGPARKLCAERGQRTIFNFLGPVLNPARPSAQLIGISRPELCEPVARVLQTLGVRRGMVVSGSVASGVARPQSKAEGGSGSDAIYLDEFSTLGDNTVAEFSEGRAIAVSTMRLDQFALQPATLADLRGGDRRANAEIIRRILSGAERGPKREVVLLNAAAALGVAGKTSALREGWDLAAAMIDSGKAQAKLMELAENVPG